MQMDIGIIAIIISGLSLLVSIYSLYYKLSKNRAILSAEPNKGVKINKEENQLIFDAYLKNKGDKPTTIKEIKFYQTGSHFLPTTKIIKLVEKSTINSVVHYPQQEPLEIPFVLESYETKRLLIKLIFPNKDIFNDETKIEKLHYTIWIEHTFGRFIQNFF